MTHEIQSPPALPAGAAESEDAAAVAAKIAELAEESGASVRWAQGMSEYDFMSDSTNYRAQACISSPRGIFVVCVDRLDYPLTKDLISKILRDAEPGWVVLK